MYISDVSLSSITGLPEVIITNPVKRNDTITGILGARVSMEMVSDSKMSITDYRIRVLCKQPVLGMPQQKFNKSRNDVYECFRALFLLMSDISGHPA